MANILILRWLCPEYEYHRLYVAVGLTSFALYVIFSLITNKLLIFSLRSFKNFLTPDLTFKWFVVSSFPCPSWTQNCWLAVLIVSEMVIVILYSSWNIHHCSRNSNWPLYHSSLRQKCHVPLIEGTKPSLSVAQIRYFELVFL